MSDTQAQLNLIALENSGIQFNVYHVKFEEAGYVDVILPHVELDDYRCPVRFRLTEEQWNKALTGQVTIQFDYRGRGFYLSVPGCARVYRC